MTTDDVRAHERRRELPVKLDGHGVPSVCHRGLLLVLVLLPSLALGCGHSEEEWQFQLRKYNQAVADRDAKDKELVEAQARIAALEASGCR
jgi:hypothetical protein